MNAMRSLIISLAAILTGTVGCEDAIGLDDVSTTLSTGGAAGTGGGGGIGGTQPTGGGGATDGGTSSGGNGGEAGGSCSTSCWGAVCASDHVPCDGAAKQQYDAFIECACDSCSGGMCSGSECLDPHSWFESLEVVCTTGNAEFTTCGSCILDPQIGACRTQYDACDE